MRAKYNFFQYSGKKPCYYCGRPTQGKMRHSREHAPPEMMFECFDCDSITVPACEDHNTKKSIGDRAIVTAMIMGARQVWKNYPKSTRITINVLRAIKAVEPYFSQAKNEVQLQKLLVDAPPTKDFNLPYINPQTKIHAWLRQLTAAMIWSIIGKHDSYFNWDKTWVWSPGYVLTSGPLTREEAKQRFIQNRNIELKLNIFNWHLGWTAKPREYPKDIYTFELCFLDYPEEWNGMNIMFKHRFYNDISVWYTCFMVSPKTKERITDFVVS
jgi:hypothetical protein